MYGLDFSLDLQNHKAISYWPNITKENPEFLQQ